MPVLLQHFLKNTDAVYQRWTLYLDCNKHIVYVSLSVIVDLLYIR